CIDKTNGVELSEAINSMFSWYRNADTCLVYLKDVYWKLDDVPKDTTLSDMAIQRFIGRAWFTRGWTLQELLAPTSITFFNKDWENIGDRDTLQEFITEMSWASLRETTREEDSAYCLLGLFGVNMPLIYGEGGTRAFIRLQEELIKSSADHTIFAWYIKTVAPDPPVKASARAPGREAFEAGNGGSGLLAQSPKYFACSGRIRRRLLLKAADTRFLKLVSRNPYHMTNRGFKSNFYSTTLGNAMTRSADPRHVD
ncbi:HET-domain-containing protein, partial [Lophiostoma macrostomum CBS 122681]